MPGAAAQHGWDRRRLRAGSDAVKRLKAMVGVSGKIYSHLLELCEVGGWGAGGGVWVWRFHGLLSSAPGGYQ